MYSTMQTIKGFINDDLCEMTYAELSDIYKVTRDNEVLASCFKKIYKLGEFISRRKRWGLESEDIESYCLEAVDRCLLTYNSAMGEFTTQFTKYFESILKHKAEYGIRKMHGVKVISYDVTHTDDSGNEVDILNLVSVEDKYNTYSDILPKTLTEIERYICDMLAVGYSQSEIARKLNISNQRVSQIKQSMKHKFIPLRLA